MVPFQPPIAETSPVSSATGRLNGVAISAFQLQSALEVLARLPAHLRGIPHVQALALQAFADDEGFTDDCASAALHARVTALAKWTAAHDPDRQSNAEAVIEAAARFPMTDEPTGIAFDPAGFQEMVLFIEELPW